MLKLWPVIVYRQCLPPAEGASAGSRTSGGRASAAAPGRCRAPGCAVSTWTGRIAMKTMMVMSVV